MFAKVHRLTKFLSLLSSAPGRRVIHQAINAVDGFSFADHYSGSIACNGKRARHEGVLRRNCLEEYFEANREGRGIWKWKHYFEVYERHLQKFCGKHVNVCEIGIYSGGSLGMWKEYFGPDCRVFGVDIEQDCQAYEDDRTSILIGDQADREFWRSVRKRVPPFDIVIDDGGHTPLQQRITLEELLPHMPLGAVYVCEDVHGQFNKFAAYAHAIADRLNFADSETSPPEPNAECYCNASLFQKEIHSVHFYPFLTVIEKNDTEVERFASAKRGTEWQPFL